MEQTITKEGETIEELQLNKGGKHRRQHWKRKINGKEITDT